MLIVLNIFKYVYFNNTTTFTAIITIIVHTIIGAVVYFIIVHKFKLLEEIFGKNYKDTLLKRFKLKR